jgi:hypothetical protein
MYQSFTLMHLAKIASNPLRQGILEMIRMRPKHPFSPEEVIQWIYPADWKYFLKDIQEEMMELYQEGLIQVTKHGLPIDSSQLPEGQVMISKIK